jgi:hypothetical protein
MPSTVSTYGIESAPKSKMHCDRALFRAQRHRFQRVAGCLPGRFMISAGDLRPSNMLSSDGVASCLRLRAASRILEARTALYFLPVSPSMEQPQPRTFKAHQ